jgi:hypothetical protein
VGVVIVSWNVSGLLRRCLQAVLRSPLAKRIIVVDNASTDGSADMVRGEFPEVELLVNASNAGFTRANNQALRALGLGPSGQPLPEFILLLNPDTELTGGALEALVTYARDHPVAGAVGPQLRYPDGTIQSSRRRFPGVLAGLVESTPVAWHWPDNSVARRFLMADRPIDEAGPVDWITGAAVLLRGGALADVGGLDEAFFMYSEELDLCRRLHDAGWEIHYCPSARVIHHEGKSSEQVVAARHLYFQQSRVRYFRKHHGRLAAATVRGGILAAYAVELLLESAKWLVGHRRPLRRARMAAYWTLLRSGLV